MAKEMATRRIPKATGMNQSAPALLLSPRVSTHHNQPPPHDLVPPSRKITPIRSERLPPANSPLFILLPQYVSLVPLGNYPVNDDCKSYEVQCDSAKEERLQ